MIGRDSTEVPSHPSTSLSRRYSVCNQSGCRLQYVSNEHLSKPMIRLRAYHMRGSHPLLIRCRECGATSGSIVEQTRQNKRRETIGEVGRKRRRSESSGGRLCHQEIYCVIRRQAVFQDRETADPAGGAMVRVVLYALLGVVCCPVSSSWDTRSTTRFGVRDTECCQLQHDSLRCECSRDRTKVSLSHDHGGVTVAPNSLGILFVFPILSNLSLKHIGMFFFKATRSDVFCLFFRFT